MKMLGLQQRYFSKLSAWIQTDLKAIRDQNGHVWQTFLRFADPAVVKLGQERVDAAIDPDALPWLFVEDIGGHFGLFDPSKPDTISIGKRFAHQFENAKDETQAEMQATILHELVHWAWHQGGAIEPPGQEQGEAFELAVAQAVATREAPRRPEPNDGELGSLSRRFESNGKPGAIGKDTNGGWSYGLYQLASKQGSIARFLTFLQDTPSYADLAAPLVAAGGDAAARRGDPGFVGAWKEAADSPRFSQAQHAFIKATHYEPFLHNLTAAGIDLTQRLPAIQDVVWSIAVQHGPGRVELFTRPWEKLDATGRANDKALINAVYAERSKVSTYFASSSEAERASVLRRFEKELADALAMA